MTATTAATPSSRIVPATLALWLVLALVAGASGAVAALPNGGPQAILVLLTMASIAAGTRVAAVRAWIDALSIRSLVALHLARFIGIAFLVLSARGLLAPFFAVKAGVGDIVAASLASVLLLAGASETRGRRWFLAWNVIGLLDFLVVLFSASWVAFHGLTPGIQLLTRLPLSLLPTFAVPVLFASHVFMIRRLVAAGSRA